MDVTKFLAAHLKSERIYLVSHFKGMESIMEEKVQRLK